MPAYPFTPQAEADEEERENDECCFHQLQPTEAESGPHGPEDDLIEPFEVRYVTAGDGVRESIGRSKLARFNDSLSGPDLPGEVQIAERSEIVSGQKDDNERAEQV